MLTTSPDRKNTSSCMFFLTLVLRVQCFSFDFDFDARRDNSTRSTITEKGSVPTSPRQQQQQQQQRTTTQAQDDLPTFSGTLSGIPTHDSEGWSNASTERHDGSASANRTGTQAARDDNETTTTHTLLVDDCGDGAVEIFGNRGVVDGLFRNSDRELSDVAVTCRWKVKVPQGFRVAGKVAYLPPCPVETITLHARGTLCNTSALYRCNYVRMMMSEENEIRFEFKAFSAVLPRFRIEFKTAPYDTVRLPVYTTSPTSGYVTHPAYSQSEIYFCRAFYKLVVPPNYVVLVSFGKFVFECSLLERASRTTFLELLDPLKNNRTLLTVRNSCEFSDIRPRVYNSSLLIRYSVSIARFRRNFRVDFSFHPESRPPVRLPGGLWDCSVPAHYASFKLHVHCNQQPECQGGEDEGGHCPFSSPACNGSLAVPGRSGSGSGGKCYRLHRAGSMRAILWSDAQGRCRALGGNLATVKDDSEWEVMSKVAAGRDSYQHGTSFYPYAYIGLQGFQSSMPNMYQYMYRWVDGTIAYGRDVGVLTLKMSEIEHHAVFPGGICSSVSLLAWNATTSTVRSVTCMLQATPHYICETIVKVKPTESGEIRNESPMQVSFPVIKDASKILAATNQSLTPCPGGHVTHDFLSCDPDSRCGAAVYPSTCVVSPLDDVTLRAAPTAAAGKEGASRTETFLCEGSEKTVHYSLACDFRSDCPDGSDEAFCVREDLPCDGFRCDNGQCVAQHSRRCDKAGDCWDGSDERRCSQTYQRERGQTRRIGAPAIVRFDGMGNFTQTPMAAADSCPDTHFRCAGQGYCLPVYVRCNGVYDCPGREDEAGCGRFSCPGFYRCRGSAVCLHASHLCDGWPQCPQHDDEWLCGAAGCPRGCVCQGLAVARCGNVQNVQPNSFPPELRYLDVSGSGLTPASVTGRWKLVWLSLANCGLRRLLSAVVDLPNLRTLDLRDNQLASVTLDVFLALENLRELRLAGNPLVELLPPEFSQRVQSSLRSIDLSRTSLGSFGSGWLSKFPRIESINISSTPSLDVIRAEGFSKTPQLRTLDLKGSPVQEFPGDVFAGLQHLDVVFADNYRLCCKVTLPDLPDVKCFAPQDEISSCQDLLRSDLYRAFLWIFSSMSVVGNAGCIVFRLFVMSKQSQRGFNVFVTNLCMSDFLMGVYLAMVGSADAMYRGQYLSYETIWRHSVGCKLAGFLSLLSNEVSAFIICLITLDRFLILRFPFSQVHFKGRSAAVACGIAWTVGFLLATVPFLPATAQWQFYSQTGICIPLPITRKSFKGRDYAFAVMIVVNFVLFLAIAAGQAVVFWTIRAGSLSGGERSTKKSKDAVIARHLASIVLSDFLCWFPIGLLGVLATAGTPVPSELNVGMAIFVLPLNAALNPFLYTFNLILERWEKAEEEQMLRDFQLSVIAEGGVSQGSSSAPRG